MSNLRTVRTLSVLLFALLLSTTAFAQEARPWLCRDKPVFSYDRSMEYQVTARPGRQWRIFFMKYSPDAAHDGFDIVDSREIRGDTGGTLTAGQYFAVALYREGGHWICPDYTNDNRNPKLGEVSNLCYGDDGPPCLVRLQVKPDHHLAAPPSP
jgi:hypothetical protein